jgi:putative ABC transport system permease protein
MFFRILIESFSQAIQQLTGNKLRSFLSLLGITIGIFCIIGVKSAVNSMEENIRSSFEKLGNDVIYISKIPWGEGGPENNFWKYQRRPNPCYEDLEVVKARVKSAEKSSFSLFVGAKTLKYHSSSVDRAFVLATTYDYADIFKLKLEKGRYYSIGEYQYGADQVIIGHQVSEQLFGALDPIGKEIKMMGRNMTVMGVIEETGRDIINPVNFDECVIMGFELARKITNVRPNNPFGGSINVKAKAGVDLDQLKDEVTVALRSRHRLSPRADNDFSLNEISIIGAFLDNIFAVMNLAGFVIGIFALLVGMFSVANIMFVSVKERTALIGIKKAIGAKRYMILLEFLIESIILCIIGGALGLLLIWGMTIAISSVLDFDIYLSFGNLVTGVVCSVAVGVISGMIPALQASKMDPVEAIRQ